MSKSVKRLGFFTYTFPKVYRTLYTLPLIPKLSYITWKKQKESLKALEQSEQLLPTQLLIKKPFQFDLIDCSEPTGSLLWQIRDDSDFGGQSRINQSYNDQEECLDVQGNINTESIDMMTNDPQVKIYTTVWPALKIREMNAIRLKFKSDGYAYCL
jgi:hypothetical protein